MAQVVQAWVTRSTGTALDGVRALTPPNTGTLASVFMVSANDVWAVGWSGLQFIHWDERRGWLQNLSIQVPTETYSSFISQAGLDGWAVGSYFDRLPEMVWDGAHRCLVCFRESSPKYSSERPFPLNLAD